MRSLSLTELERQQRPIRKRDVVPYQIGRVSSVFNNAPNVLTGEEKKHYHQKRPKNVFSGIGYGSWEFLKGVGKGVSGLVSEPYKGAKNGGVKGMAKGAGKGIIGLVAKPIAGTFGLV